VLLTLALSLVLGHSACAQKITVVAATPRSTTAQLSLTECGRPAGGPWTARIGYGGVSAHRHEGDGTTPLGTFAIGPTVYGLDPNPGVHLRYHHLVCGDWWDEDATSPAYNQFKHVACGTTPPFGGASEPLWQSPRAYREFAFVEYNAHPVVPGRGSAIFLHDDKGSATNGCISLPRPELLTVLRWLRPGATISIKLA
jgi:L,D-peptidoglycan transpeptidase YkuD (ErfK/YbiS/YcfS/YnhG family)